jgi:hypothetical protein
MPIRRTLALAPATALVLAAALVLGPPASRAGEGGSGAALEAVPLDALVAAIGAWVAAELDLEAAAPPPEIRRDAPERLAALRGWEVGNPGRPGHAGVLALYDAAAGRIHLRSDWTGGSVAEVSVLVHEMVHHAQAVAGRRYACAGAAEAEAYALQARWLAHFREDLGALGVDPLFVRLLGACGL